MEAPELPEGVDPEELDRDARRELLSLSKPTADAVASHLVAAGQLIDEDPERALAHARYARSRASRIGLVREAAGLAAYHAGEWSEALGELRAARRMTTGTGHLAVIADCERALGRAERALELTRSAEAATLTGAEAVELRIVAAGARRDLGQVEAAVVALQGPDLDPKRRDDWSARLFYAYADSLLAAGRDEEALRWFLRAADADDNDGTDAGERAVALSERLRGVGKDAPEVRADQPESVATRVPSAERDSTDASVADSAERVGGVAPVVGDEDDLTGDALIEGESADASASERVAQDDVERAEAAAAVVAGEDDLAGDAAVEGGTNADEQPGAGRSAAADERADGSGA